MVYVLMILLAVLLTVVGLAIFAHTNKTMLAAILLFFGIMTGTFSVFGLCVEAGYQYCIEDMEKKELIEKQEELIQELGLTEEQLELLNFNKR